MREGTGGASGAVAVPSELEAELRLGDVVRRMFERAVLAALLSRTRLGRSP